MSEQVTIYGEVTLEFTLEEVFVDDATSREAVQAKAEKVIGDHLGIHNYTFAHRWSAKDLTVEVSDWESA